jgi:hypothetical protein
MKMVRTSSTAAVPGAPGTGGGGGTAAVPGAPGGGGAAAAGGHCWWNGWMPAPAMGGDNPSSRERERERLGFGAYGFWKQRESQRGRWWGIELLIWDGDVTLIRNCSQQFSF